MATLVAAAAGETPQAAAAESPRHRTRLEKLQADDEVIEFLLEHFVSTEPILASLQIENKRELSLLLMDLLKDCAECSSSNVMRNTENGQLVGVCMASKATAFDNQMDRLCVYQFQDVKLRIATEFLKYVFNRADVAYHLEENKITKPVFVALVSVRQDYMRQGLASMMIDHCLKCAREDRCDGALSICSGNRARPLMTSRFHKVVCRIRYCDYRGEYREPPITPSEGDSALHVVLTSL